MPEVSNGFYSAMKKAGGDKPSMLSLSMNQLNMSKTQEEIDLENQREQLELAQSQAEMNAYEQGSSDAFNTALKYGSDKTIVDVARSYIGQNRYVYGGFDCSKFVQEAAARAGYNIPRTTFSQQDYFKRKGMFSTNMSKIQPGDIIYFRTSGPSGQHTGIYVGNGKMIDNAGRGKPIAIRSISGRTVLGYGRASQFKKNIGDPKVQPRSGLNQDFQHRLALANRKMRDAGLGTFTINSGYRSRKEQTKLHKLFPEKFNPPGQSLHEVGLSADINLTKAQLAWLQSNAAEFGLHQPDRNEPWHWQPTG